MEKKLLYLFLFFFILINKNTQAQQSKRIFVFGHSLIVHSPPVNPTPSNETTVPHWLHFLAEHNGNSVAVSGQYGFLPQHDNLPPFSQWGFDHVTPAWESDTETFDEADFNTVLITPANFIQYKPSNENYDGAENMTSPVLSTINIIDWLEIQEPTITTYIYENWPDMGGFTTANEIFTDTSFPTSEEFNNYNTYTQGDFHDWWIDYQDFIQADRPDENVRLIPVGSIISKLLSQAPLNAIPILDLYEDNAPHGRPTIYFLASLITNMAIYEEKFPATYSIPNTVNALIQNNFQETIDFIWDELLAFDRNNGESRVFVNDVLSVEENLTNEKFSLFPNPSTGFITINGIDNIAKIEIYDTNGRLVFTEEKLENNSINLSKITKGVYIMKITNAEHRIVSKKIIKEQ